MKKKRNYKKLTIDDRMIIQAGLANHESLTQIAKRLHKNKSTVSKEISRNGSGHPGYERCKTSFICNVCPKRGFCTRPKFYYDFIKANQIAEREKVVSRAHSRLSVDQITFIDSIVTPCVQKGQSLHHIYISNKELQSLCCERTIRRLIYRDQLTVRPFNLRRYTAFKHELKKKEEPRNKIAQINNLRDMLGRTYQDYINYRFEHKRANIVEFDSVIGTLTDKKAILTITLVKYNFQFGLLIEKGSPSSVCKAIRNLFDKIGIELAKKIFAICICDNGSEFSSFFKLETYNQIQIIKTFYTRPYKSSDKPTCERLHEFVRYVLPKGHSLDHLTQDDLDEMFSHINSYSRKSLGDKCPYNLVKRAFGTGFLKAINIRKINPKDVCLKPRF
jgi:IS30 family transposase